jgi:c-di-GMP-binding flagellar brake protein YcgR
MTKLDKVSELRSAVRFPLHLPVTVRTAPNQQRQAETADISAGGVLFYVDDEIRPGSRIDFDIVMPGNVLGLQNNVLVHCNGRVVRSKEERGRRCVAAVIDDYAFDSGVGRA